MTTYTAELVEVNSWNVDGSAIVRCDCGHKHKSIRTALKCYNNYLEYNPTQAVRIIDNSTGNAVCCMDIEYAQYDMYYNGR